MSSRRIVLLGLVMLWELAMSHAAMAAPSFERRVWTRADGAPQSAYAIAQDADGMLWFATVTGLYSFDGVRFARQESVYGHALRSNNVVNLLATRDGIAVGYQFGGVSEFTRAGARHYTTADGLPAGSVGVLAADAAHTLYAGTSTGLARLDAKRGKWTGMAGLSAARSYILWAAFDGEGTLWAVSNSMLYAMEKGAARFRQVAPLPQNAFPAIIGGKLVAYTGAGQLTRFAATGAPQVWPNAVGYNRDLTLFAGPDATVWAWLKQGTTVLRSGTDGVLRAAQAFEGGGLPGRMVSRTLVDRENNLWVSTLDGVERYRVRRLTELPLPATELAFLAGRGLGDDMLVASGAEGRVWRSAAGAMQPLPGPAGITAMYREHAGSVWLGGTAGLFHMTPAGTAAWPLPAHVGKDFDVQAITVDRTGKTWVSIVRHGLFQFSNGTWTRLQSVLAGGDETPICMLTGASGRTWLGFTNGRLGELTDAGVRLVAPGLASPVGNILSLLEHDGALLVGGDRGVVLLRDGVAYPLVPERAPAFLGISGMGVDRRGDLWLHGPDGLLHIAAAELLRFRADPAHRLPWEAFNFEDGMRGQVAQIRPLPSLAIATDGKVYYATGSQVGRIDPAAIRRNARPPTVLVQSVRTRGGSWNASQGMTLAPGTTAVEIDYTATALSIPERVRFRYRLAGVDQEWQEPQSGRAARYTNLGPGDYRFQVAAANEDGVWNESGATLDFRIAPTVWQTVWFRAAAAIALVSLLFALYRWRIAAAARRAAEKTAARIEERERIARNLHDNLLQGVQALILNCHAVLARMPKGSPEEKTLGDALARADLVIEDTRDEVMNLRREAAQAPLVARLAHAIEGLDPAVRGRVELAVTGCPELLDAAAADELFYVLHEAIVNSARHSGAARIAVSLHATAAGVEASVADDGCGIEAGVAQAGRAGHWGLVGMRERIARLGGTLRIGGGPGQGCVVSFSVPLAPKA
ncbi:triple tyrosine motif-containing protein [Pseudoduganella sp. SL102]|uniref:sensor histidine kinase n=1 Tax=Pseudoduganella sp. SL102 TaxID=2995154 RepID=UPI00248AF708|nr:sensor histidine kinase [Pseudoduganella sp. SL102]WBS04864.1 triple tyrosine motif-containing protein [Pseudoduganella sp. SL102]